MAAPPTLVSEEESILRVDDIISSLSSVLVEEMTEEMQLALVLKSLWHDVGGASGPGYEFHL